jgi:predicted acylesterase/phospholipase RssA
VLSLKNFSAFEMLKQSTKEYMQKPSLTNSKFIGPKECDVVMQGGITSGVVYPKFIALLSSRFKLRNIGGTSAGAISASAAAAAQYAKNNQNVNTFAEIDQLPTWLFEPSKVNSKNTNLKALFQPSSFLKSHFNVIAGALNTPNKLFKVFKIILALVLNFPFSLIVGALVWYALSSFLVRSWAITSVDEILLIIFFGFLWQGIYFTFSLLNRLAKNEFGICSGHDANQNLLTPPLTDWLYRLQQRLARLALTRPLTFGDLWGDQDKKNIDLAMLTSCISECRGMRLPFDDFSFVFSRKEMQKLFPDDVVNYMCQNAGDPNDQKYRLDGIKDRFAGPSKVDENNKFIEQTADKFLFPEPRNFPVIVATRMSLSFPILLSAVPLYRIRKDAGETLGIKRVWFSDGGLISNFPIHFFDSMLPQRPTFGVSLYKVKTILKPQDRANLPDNNSENSQYDWANLNERETPKSTIQFLGTAFNTIRVWRDQSFSHAPGFRDRIVQIRHLKTEGGLNLDMPEDHIKALSDSGYDAASKIIARFCDAPIDSNGWANHQRVRLCSSTAMLQQLLKDASEAYNSLKFFPTFKELLSDHNVFGEHTNLGSTARQSAAKKMFDGLMAVNEIVENTDLVKGQPKPSPHIVIEPRQ